MLYGGARGGGKSDSLLAHCVSTALTYSGAQVLLIRKEYAEMTKPKAVIPRSFDFLTGLQENGICSWHSDNHEWKFKNGSVIQFGHLSDGKAVHKYLGTQADLIALDQAEELTYDEFSRLKGSLRSTGAYHHHDRRCQRDNCP